MNAVERVSVETGAAIAFGAHFSKGNQSGKNAIDRVSGSGVFARDPDTLVSFTAHEEADCFTVETTLRNLPPSEPFVVRWEYPLFVRDDLLDPLNLKTVGRPSKYTVDDAFGQLGDLSLTCEEWAQRIGCTTKTLRPLRDELARTDRAEYVDKKWRKKR